MEERNLLPFTKPNNEITQDKIEKMFPYKSDFAIDMDILANKVATKLNTQLINDELKRNSAKIDELSNGIASLINTIKKQTVDENNTSFKIARNNEKASIIVDSLDSHISFIISFTHIAQCYHLGTDKDDNKPSVNKARKLVMELNLLQDKNFVSKSLSGSKTVSNKYHYSILSEIKNRLENPEAYGIPKDIAEKWRSIAFIPNYDEIDKKINEIFELLK